MADAAGAGARIQKPPIDPRTLPPVTGDEYDYHWCVHQNPVRLRRKQWRDWEDYWRRRGEDPPA